jgi:hypothetical protein
MILQGLGSHSEAIAGMFKNDLNLQRDIRRKFALQAE